MKRAPDHGGSLAFRPARKLFLHDLPSQTRIERMVLYVADRSDSLGSQAVLILGTLGAPIQIQEPSCCPEEAVAFFSSEGRYPSRYFRLISDPEKDCKYRGIIIPDWVLNAKYKIAINMSRSVPPYHEDFISGVTQIYAQYSQWQYPKTSKKDRHRKRMHEERSVYML